MANKPKAVITVETHKLTIVRQLHEPIFLWCEQCAAQVEMIAPEFAATILGVKVREIYRRIEQGKLHFFETETGEVFICHKH